MTWGVSMYFYVYDEYELVGNDDKCRIIGKNLPNSKGNYRKINPNGGFYLELAELDILDDKAIVDFACKYGSLGVFEASPMQILTHINTPMELMPKKPPEIIELGSKIIHKVPSDNLMALYREVKAFQGIFRLFKKYQRDLDLKTKEELIERLNFKMVQYNVFAQLTVNSDDVISSSAAVVDPFSLAIFQISKALLNNEKIGICKNCYHYFQVQANNGKFCHNNLDSNGKSRCASSYTSRKNRVKKKWENGERDALKVSKSIKRPLTEVEEWFKEWE